MSAAAQSRYRVQGMDCASCAQKIDTAVCRIEGVSEVQVSVTAGTMTVGHSDEGAIRQAIEKQVARLGYRLDLVAAHAGEVGVEHAHHAGCRHDHGHGAAHGEHDHAAHQHGGATSIGGQVAWWRQPQVRLTAACGLAVAGAYLLGHLLPWAGPSLFIAAMLVGLVPIARRAFAAATAGSPFSIEMLMTVAAVGAVLIGAAEEGAVVVFLFLVGELLEGVAAGRARASIQGLTALVPRSARVEEDRTGSSRCRSSG